EGRLMVYSGKRDHEDVTDIGLLPKKEYGALPEAFISPAAARRHGWEPTRSGWLVEAGRGLTDAERLAARDLALEEVMTVETRDEGASLATLRVGATAGGMLLALGILAMTVGL